VLVAAAVVPHPPLLVPGVAGANDEPAVLRAAATAAVRRVADARPDLLVLVGGGPADAQYDDAAWGSLARFGRPEVLPRGAGPPTLPLSLTVAQWLLDQVAPGTRDGHLARVAVDTRADTAHCARLGADLAARAPRVGLVVAGDASARRSRTGPGYLDERAEPFDAAVIDALATGDGAALLGVDAVLADDLLVAGRAAWQVLAGAAGLRVMSAEVTYAAAPYGVCYLVATWVRLGKPA
jgi:hypothetical protein